MELCEIVRIDLWSCAKLFSRTFTKEPWNENWSTDSAYKRLEHFYDSKGFCGVLAKEDSVSGLVLGNIEPYFFGPIFYLREMCIDVNCQNNGIGTQLLLYIEGALRLKGVHNIYLLTEHNFPAAQFYQKRGYEADQNTGLYLKKLTP